MCFKRPKTPAVVRTDVVGQQRQAEDAAAGRANREVTDRNIRRRRTALQTQGSLTGTSGTALQTYGQTTLGNGL